MRDLAILEEWLVKVRQQKRDGMQKTLVSAMSDSERVNAQHYAHCIITLDSIIEAVRMLDKDPAEFVKRNLG